MKRIMALAALVLVSSLAFAKGSGDKKEAILTIGATPVPHAELLNLVKEDLAAEGVTLKVREFNDYVQPNEALIAGDLDANFFQHIPYLGSNADWEAKLVSAFGVHVEPFGLYSRKVQDIRDLPDGASIAIPNDPTNGGRALLLLQSYGLLTLNPDAGISALPGDITDNPHGFRFQELEAAQLPRSLDDVDAAAINGNYALEAGLNPAQDALIIEGAQSPYVNIVVVRKGFEGDPRIKALQKVLLSDKVKGYIQERWQDGSVAPVF